MAAVLRGAFALRPQGWQHIVDRVWAFTYFQVPHL